jgi:hypothetical protein
MFWLNWMGAPDEPGLDKGRLEWHRREANRRGQHRNRMVPLETNYHPGLDNPVSLDDYCPMFTYYIRKHRPDETFVACEYCSAPIWRPDKEI